MNNFAHEVNISCFSSEIYRYPILNKEQEYEITKEIFLTRKKLLFYLSLYPEFYIYLTKIRRQLYQRKILPQNIFHHYYAMQLEHKSNIQRKRPYFFYLMENLDKLERICKDWFIELENEFFCIEGSEKRRESINEMYAKKGLKILKKTFFMQKFLSQYIDKLDNEHDFSIFNSKKKLFSEHYINKIYNSLLNERRKHFKASESLIKSNLRLVLKIAKRYLNNNVSYIDIIQEGIIGLMKAVDRFDYTLGNRFSTYATWWIKQSISRAILQQGRVVRLPIHQINKIKHLHIAIEKLQKQLKHEPSLKEISDEINKDEIEILYLFSLAMIPKVLEPNINKNEDNIVSNEDLVDDKSVDPVKIINLNSLKLEFNKLLKTLSAKEQKVIELRYGITVERKHTLEEVGYKLGVTRERIRQIEHQALKKLKHPSRSRLLVQYL